MMNMSDLLRIHHVALTLHNSAITAGSLTGPSRSCWSGGDLSNWINQVILTRILNASLSRLRDGHTHSCLNQRSYPKSHG